MSSPRPLLPHAVPSTRKTFMYTIECDLRHKKLSPMREEEKSDAEIFEVDINTRPKKRLRIFGDTDSEDEAHDEASASLMKQEKELSVDEIKTNVSSLSRLLMPLEVIKKKTREFGERIENDQFNTDFRPFVTTIEKDIEKLYSQVVECKTFYTFLLESKRPIQAEFGYFGMLPTELLLKIFSYLEGKDLLVSMMTCTLFSKTARDETLWKAVCERHWQQDILLNQKPCSRTWRWLFECKMVIFSPPPMLEAIFLTLKKTSLFSMSSRRVRPRTGKAHIYSSMATSTKASGRKTSATVGEPASWPMAAGKHHSSLSPPNPFLAGSFAALLLRNLSLLLSMILDTTF